MKRKITSMLSAVDELLIVNVLSRPNSPDPLILLAGLRSGGCSVASEAGLTPLEAREEAVLCVTV